MCLNQVDHVFKPSRSCVETTLFHLVLCLPGNNLAGHVFKPGLAFSLPHSHSLSLYCYFSIFLVFFLSFFFASSFFSLALFVCFCSENNIKIINRKFGFFNVFRFLVSCLVLSFRSLFYLCFFLILCCFCSKKCSYLSNKTTYRTPIFGDVGGCNQQMCFFITCVLENVKSYRFGGPFSGKIMLMFKNTVKYVFQHIFETERQIKYHFEELLSGPDNNSDFLAHNFFFSKKMC